MPKPKKADRRVIALMLALLTLCTVLAGCRETSRPETATDTDISPAETSFPEGGIDSGTDGIPLPETEPESETEAETETETESETESETEEPLSLYVPDYTDIHLTDRLSGKDETVNRFFDFSEGKVADYTTNNQLVFTQNKPFTVTKDGLTITNEGWNSVGFAHECTDSYTASAHLIARENPRGGETSAVMLGVRVRNAPHLFIDSGLWFLFRDNQVCLYVKGKTETIRRCPFSAEDGLDVTVTDDGTNIVLSVNGNPVVSAVVGENNLTVSEAGSDSPMATFDLTYIAHGESRGFVRTMSHFANASIRSMSLKTGHMAPYAPPDKLIAFSADCPYFFEGNRKIRMDCPVVPYESLHLADETALASLFGFRTARQGDRITWERDDARLTFTVGKASVDFNGESFPFPTVIDRKGTVLISSDYIARFLGLQKTTVNGLIVLTGTGKPDKEEVSSMENRYKMYRDIVYNHDDVECDQRGVGKYEKTPYKDRLIGMAYTTWHRPSTKWGSPYTWDVPMYGPYLSDDRDVLYRHGILLRDAGVDFVFVDWSNNTCYDPATMRETREDFRTIEESTDRLFEVWSTIPGAPKICIFAGPGHSGIENVTNGNHQRKVDQIYRDYVEKYPDLYFRYEGKPLLICYGATPNQYSPRPKWHDDRFTNRWITGYVGQQPGMFHPDTLRSSSFWSWEEREAQTYTVTDGRVECITCSAATRSQSKEGEPGYIPAHGRENGATLKKQFQRANDLGAGMVLLVSWNEWTTGEQPSAEISKDLEPSQIHGTFYYDLLCEQIKKFKGAFAE